MSRSADHRSVRRVVLPSGKTIEVLYFEEQRDGTGDLGGGRTVEGLHVCPHCASRLVSPVAWEEAGPAHWDVTLHCPNCDWLGSGVFDEELVERFDEELDRGTEALVLDLQRLMRANMEDEIDRFVAALAADQIWPMDF
jgi:predicted sugar kinase